MPGMSDQGFARGTDHDLEHPEHLDHLDPTKLPLLNVVQDLCTV